MADEATRKAAIAELARRELARRQATSDPAAPQAAEQATQPGPKSLDYLKRQAGLTARAALEGVNDVVSPFTNAAGWLMNQPLKAMGADYRFPDQNWAASNLLSQAGLPEPETGYEKAGNFGGRLMSGMAAGTPLSKLITSSMGLTPPAQTITRGKPPSTTELKRASQGAYNAADRAGVVISQKAFRTTADDIANTLAKEGLDPTLHPKVTAVVKRLSEVGNDVSFQEAETLRKVVKSAAASNEPAERRLAQIAIGKLDDLISNLKPADVVSGDPVAASTQINRARDLWSRSAKSAEIDELFRKAHVNAPNFSASGLENAVRTQFRQLARNPKRMRLFTKAEQAAITKVAEGGKLDNALRALGKLAPTGIVSGSMSAGAGYMVGGTGGALALPALGGASRLAATYGTLRNARGVSDLVRGAPLVPGVLQPSAVGQAATHAAPGAAAVTGEALNPLLIEYLLRGDSTRAE